jgi:hypothetical protein
MSPVLTLTNTGVSVVQPGNGVALNLKTTTDLAGVSMVVIDGGTVVLPTGDKVTIDKVNANLTQQGFNADIGVYWGRWEAKVPVGTGPNAPMVTGVFQTLYSPHVTSAVELEALKAAASGTHANPALVTATYTYVGGPTPVRSDGQNGEIKSMTVGANFSTQKITQYDVNVQFGAGQTTQVWDAHLDKGKADKATFANFSGTGASVAGGGPGISLNGNCTNCANGTAINGTARGQFTGNDARGLMTIFELQNGINGAIVTGTGALKRP